MGGKGTSDGWLPWADVRAVYELLDARFCRHRWRSGEISDEATSPTSLRTLITLNAMFCSSIHPSVICTAYPSGSYGSCSQSQLALGERRGSPRAGPHGTVMKEGNCLEIPVNPSHTGNLPAVTGFIHSLLFFTE